MIDLICDRVSKRYRRGRPSGWHRAEEFWALRDVSFQVARGETFGIIGHNGAGKSTVLKLLSNITRPTSGQIRYWGRLSALIELGSGFHPELTGRENVMMSGAILGMKRREIRDKLPLIVEFSGVGDFIDTPVKWYSSGMYVRLGFSIAAHLSPDILLIDEVLAVGDAEFQQKCLQRITEMKQSGTTIVFISHDLSAVRQLCDRVLLLDHGRVVADGAADETVDAYLRKIGAIRAPSDVAIDAVDQGAARIRSISVLDGLGARAVEIPTGNPFRVRVDYDARDALHDVLVEVFLFTRDGSALLCQMTTGLDGIEVARGPGAVEFTSAALPLQPGTYVLGALIKRRAARDAIDWLYGQAALVVAPGKLARGYFYMPVDWRVLSGGNAIAWARETAGAD